MVYFNKLLVSKNVLLLFFVIGLFVYGNSIFNGFVWDDEEQIVKNFIIQDLGNIGQIFSGATFSTGGAGLSGYFFRPFITLTFMLNYLLWGENAFGFHLFQIIFHILNGFLIFKIFSYLGEASRNSFSGILALVLAAIYVVHPAITEGVVYIAAVSEVMFTFFILLAFYLVLKCGENKPEIKTLSYVCLLLFGACLFKEPAVVGAPILIGYVVIFLRKYKVRWILSLVGVLILYFFVRLAVVQTPIQHPLYSLISEATLQERFLTIPAVIFHYLVIIFYPAHLAISQHFVVRNPDSEGFLIPLVIVLMLNLLALFYGIKTKNKLILFSFVWLVISAGPILNIIPLDMTVAERWLYFPLIGFLMLVYGLSLKIKNQSFLKIVVGFLLMALIPLSIRTVVRNSDWKDGLTLYSHDSLINPESFDLQNNLGVELFRIGKVNEAKSHFEKSIALQPKWHYAINNLGAVYQREGNYEAAKRQYLKVLESSDYYLAHENLSSIYILEKDYKKAKESSEKSLKKLPNNPVLWLNLAIANYQLGDNKGALVAAKNSYQLLPGEQAAYVYSALSQGRKLKFEE